MNIGEDLVVVGPCWRGQVDGRRGLWDEFAEEKTSQMNRTSTRYSLQRDGLDRY